jgi:hypothetical protein
MVVFVEEDDVEALQEFADSDSVVLSEYVRRVLRRHVEAQRRRRP